MNRLLACLLLATSLPLMAQVYTYTDAQGNPVFTNEPPPEGVNAQTVNVPPVNGAEVPAASNYAPPPTVNEASPPPPATQQQTTDASNSDNDNNAEYDDGYYADDYDRRRAAEAAVIDRRSNPAIHPEVNKPVMEEAAPDRIEVPEIRR
jgi:hypothetical protein